MVHTPSLHTHTQPSHLIHLGFIKNENDILQYSETVCNVTDVTIEEAICFTSNRQQDYPCYLPVWKVIYLDHLESTIHGTKTFKSYLDAMFQLNQHPVRPFLYY